MDVVSYKHYTHTYLSMTDFGEI